MSFDSPASHRESIIQSFVSQYRTKYDRGQQEHGGVLWQKDNLSMAQEEALDLISYLYTADYQRQQALRLLQSVLLQHEAGVPLEIERIQEAVDMLSGTLTDGNGNGNGK